MTALNSLLREDQDLQYFFTNFTNPDTMEGNKKGGTSTNNGAGTSLKDLVTKLDKLTLREALTVKGGTAKETDQWNTYCGGKVPQ
jgi:hypothetical protein